MECKREEACNAKEIAEEKFRAHDLKGSYWYAQKAYDLYPELEGISQLITAMQVHLAAEDRLDSGLIDWYAILQVNVFSDPALIKKQYRKLALALHPDKNKSLEAEGAFKLIREAWAVLSDKFKKRKYDCVRRCLLQKEEEDSEPGHPDPIATSSKAQKSTINVHMDVDSLKTQNVDFCNRQGSSTATPVASVKDSAQVQSFMHTHMTFPGNPNVDSFNGDDTATPLNKASVKSGHVNSTFWTECSSCKAMQECQCSQEGHQIRCEVCLSLFQAEEIATMSLNELNRRTRKRSRHNNSVMIENEMNLQEDNKPQESKDRQAINQSKKAKRGPKKIKNGSRMKKNSVSSPVLEDPSVKIVDPGSINVQDSEFYDFDKDRIEECFEENQIWAIYDDYDGMPRYYALINKIISLHPFKVQMSWLEGKDNGDENLIRWASTGIWRSCGELRVGRKTTTEFLNVFSHLMKGEKAVAGLLKIFPRKGSVWALYRNWQCNWDESTPKEVIRQYENVEVITDFTETMGGSVIPLVKLDGFKTVYHRIQMGSKAVRWVLRTEFLRFSHQVPARRLLGNEGQNLPQGCWELDPAASAMDLSAENLDSKTKTSG